MRYLLSFFLFAVGVGPLSATADDSQWFAAVKASFGAVTIDDVSHGGSIGTGMLIGNDVDGEIKERSTDDYTAGLGVAAGKRWGNWTLEGEFIYRYRTDWDVVAPTPSIQTITNVFANVETNTLMLNLVRRGVLNRRWSWEVGAGAGLVRNTADAEYIERATPTQPQRTFDDKKSKTDFSYTLLAGVTRELRGPWTLNVRYRYIDLGELKVGPFPQRPARLSADHRSHEIQFALERTF